MDRAVVHYSRVQYGHICDAAGTSTISCKVSDQLTGFSTKRKQASNVQSCLCHVLEQRQIPTQHTDVLVNSLARLICHARLTQANNALQ